MKNILNFKTYVIYVEGFGYYKGGYPTLINPKFTRNLEEARTFSDYGISHGTMSLEKSREYIDSCLNSDTSEDTVYRKVEILEVSVRPVVKACK